ncbi:hypothetical protein HK098_004966 [Nowakowskiella sp. JEL0407]|nr:hypothetical protein HK098_004966 [Nowakowskiella sp. JEL0407]
MEIITNKDSESQQKYIAFEGFQELVENLDNANDLRPLNMWRPLLDISQTSSDPKLRFFAGWVIGSAVYNNAIAQKDCVDLHGLNILIDRFAIEEELEVKTKILFAISGLILHNLDSFNVFIQKQGFDLIKKELVPYSPDALSQLASKTSLESDSRKLNPYCLQNRILFLLKSLVTFIEYDEKPTAAVSQEKQIALTAAEIIVTKGILSTVLEITFENRINGVEAASEESTDLIEKALYFIRSLAGLIKKFPTQFRDLMDMSLRKRILSVLIQFTKEPKRDGYWDLSEEDGVELVKDCLNKMKK